MSYKILEANGVDIENVDGGALNAFFSARLSGVVSGVLSECSVTASGSVLGISPGLLILCGVRVKITEQETIAMDSAPSAETMYQLVAQAKLGVNRDVSVSFFVQPPKTLVRDNLYEREFGTYQFELATFTHNTDGSISAVKTATPIVAPFYSRQETEAILTAQTEDVKAILTAQTQKVETALAETKEELDLKTNKNTQAIAANVEAIASNAEAISENSAKIHNLTGVLLEEGVTDVVKVEQAYSMRQTADGENIVDYNGEGQFTFPEKIKGATVKTTNLIPYPFYQGNRFTNEGITYTVNSDGSITMNGTSTAYSLYRFMVENNGVFEDGKTYTLSISFNEGVTVSALYRLVLSFKNEAGTTIYIEAFYGHNGISFTWSDEYSFIQLQLAVAGNGGVVVDNVTAYCMINPGDTAKPFSPYFAGLKNSFFKGVKSTGRNLIVFPYVTTSWSGSNGVKAIVNDNGSIAFNGTPSSQVFFNIRTRFTLKAGTYTLSSSFAGGSGSTYNLTLQILDGYLSTDKQSVVAAGSSSKTFTINTDVPAIIYVVIGNGVSINETCFPMLNLGSTAFPYEPYKSDESFMLDEPLELGEWDIFYRESSEVTRATKKIVFDGTEAWESYYQQTTKGAYTWVIKIDGKKIGEKNVVCDGYIYKSSAFDVGAVGEFCGHSSLTRVYFATAHTTLDDWKAHLAELYAAGKPLTVAYELATPTKEFVEFPTKKYRSWNEGSETLVQGDTDNSTFGAMPTVTQEYFVKVGGVTDEQTE